MSKKKTWPTTFAMAAIPPKLKRSKARTRDTEVPCPPAPEPEPLNPPPAPERRCAVCMSGPGAWVCGQCFLLCGVTHPAAGDGLDLASPVRVPPRDPVVRSALAFLAEHRAVALEQLRSYGERLVAAFVRR